MSTRRRRRNPNIVSIIAIAVVVVLLFVLVPKIGDWILEKFIYPTEPNADPTEPSSSVSAPTTPSTPDVQDIFAPVISGVRDLETYVGSTISYKTGVTVTDDLDAKPTLEIDNSQVDLSKPGVYNVTYTATDASGNATSITVKLTVKVRTANFVEPEVIYAKADAILSQFIRDDMTDREKAEAVYVWTRRGVHLSYGSKPAGFVHEEADWLQTAYQLLNTEVAKGDCYFFFAAQ